jgi:hypothetical protein
MTMRNFLLAGAIAAGALLATPQMARADCLIEAVSSCDKDFGGANNKELIAVRGWCYLIRAGICSAFD